MDTSTTSQDDRVIVTLHDNCTENPTTFVSTLDLSYGSCLDKFVFQESQPFDSSETAVFALDLSSVTGNACIRVVVAHQSQPDRPLNTLERELKFNSCRTASISSLAGSRVSILFSAPVSSGRVMVPHGTVALFQSTSSAYTLTGPSQSTCRDGQWTNFFERQTNREHINFVLIL